METQLLKVCWEKKNFPSLLAPKWKIVTSSMQWRGTTVLVGEAFDWLLTRYEQNIPVFSSENNWGFSPLWDDSWGKENSKLRFFL